MTDLRSNLPIVQDRHPFSPFDVKITVDGPETPETRQIACRLRNMLVAGESGLKAYLVTHGLSRRARRRAAALNRRGA